MFYYASVAQLVEHPTDTRKVPGSIPGARTLILFYFPVSIGVEWACGGIGIRVRLRSVWSNPWEFESPHAHSQGLLLMECFLGTLNVYER